MEATYKGKVEGSAPEGGEALASSVAEPGAATPWQPPRSRVDHSREEVALACVHRGDREEALKILMTAYGAPLMAFIVRTLRDRELAKDVRQHVFLAAFQRIDTFEGRSSLWSWLCGIAFHRCLDELRRNRRSPTLHDFDVLDALGEPSEPMMDPARLTRRRALEQCLGKLSPAMRTQLLMRCFLGLSYAEVGEAVGEAHGTVQVRISRILPRLRRCLQGEGVTR